MVADVDKNTLNLCCPQPTRPASSQTQTKQHKLRNQTGVQQLSQPLLSLPTLTLEVGGRIMYLTSLTRHRILMKSIFFMDYRDTC